MIIECQACHARFRLDESKIKGRGARVRCRRCAESILVMKDEPSAAPPETAAPRSLPGEFDLTLAVGGSLEQSDDILVAEPAAIPDPSLDGVDDLDPPVYESGTDPFADGAGEIPAIVEPPASPPLLTETPFELSPPEAPPPAAPSPEIDEVDLAFEQFLADSEGAPPPATDGAVLETTPETVEPPSFLLNDAETLEILGNEQVAPETEKGAPSEPPPANDDPFAFQLDEEVLRIPEETGASPFTGNAIDDREMNEPEPPANTGPRESPPPRQQPLPQEVPVPKSALRGEPAVDSREPVIRPAVAFLAILFFALSAAGGYLGFTETGRSTLKSLVPSMGSLLGEGKKGKPGGPQFDIRNLIGYYDNTVKAGRMFVIKGQVANTGSAAKGRIRIHAALLDNTNRILVEKTVYAGNVLGGEELRLADKESIEKTLSSPFGENLTNLDVAPGKSVPFMVVFLDIPEGIDAYRLEAKEGE